MTGFELRLGPKWIGTRHPPLIIAEMSGNHRGKLEGALEIVRTAADCGAGAIKLQTFTPATLTIDSTRPEFTIDDPTSPWHGRRLWELYAEAHTPWEWHEPVFRLARALGLGCISSAFDDSSLRFLLELDVDAIKIASFELVHVPLLEAVARSRKPVLISTGMASLPEIDDAVAALRGNGCEEFILLKCTSAYPSEERDANVLTMQAMGTRYQSAIGLSDHTLTPFAAYASVALGAAVIEKHLTLRRDDGGVDAAFSLEPAELRELVAGVRSVWLTRGEVEYGPRPAEAASLRERPSIYVVLPVRKGESLTEMNTRIIRPGNGLAPKHYKSILGRRALRDIDAETPLTFDMLN